MNKKQCTATSYQDLNTFIYRKSKFPVTLDNGMSCTPHCKGTCYRFIPARRNATHGSSRIILL